MEIIETLYYTYHILDSEDDSVMEIITGPNLENLQRLVADTPKGYRAVYVGRQYHAIWWKQTDPLARDFLLELRDAPRIRKED
tara:strand:+ start:239 stop:487 length:249 start_codon:yes stop_codon:yes gene_type:complete